MQWFVVYTKPKQELKVEERLKAFGIMAYCPTIKVMKQWSDRKKKITKPLINSYVFVCIDSAKRADVFAVPGVVRYLYWLGVPVIVKEEEIERLQRTVEGKLFSRIEISNWQLNQQVKISNGAFEGLLAVVQKTSNNKIYLTLESLGMTLILEY